MGFSRTDVIFLSGSFITNEGRQVRDNTVYEWQTHLKRLVSDYILSLLTFTRAEGKDDIAGFF